MLKSESFQLYSDCAPDVVTGIVKSQSNPDLTYACRLSVDGYFSCCTQNLNACGGLRGALCKHILVLIIGLAKSGEIDAVKASQWVLSSRIQKPKLHAELMTETFLKYKGSEAGEIDWRPTETIPEDYYAF